MADHTWITSATDRECADLRKENDTLRSQLTTQADRIRELEGASDIVEVHADQEVGGFWTSIKSKPGCATQGDTLPELFRNLADAIECWDEASEDINSPRTKPDTQ